MRWFALLAGIVCTPAIAQQHIAPTNALSPRDELASFTVPKGFAVQLVASEPDIEKPMQIAWDSRGRLWVTTSHHYPFAAEPGKASDKLFVLSDFDANGKAKKIQVFDDKLNIPIGNLPLPDGKSCIVSSCGEILKLTDTNADGVADTREVLFSGFGFTDTHGMTNSFTLMPDGWVYACHGFSNKSKVKGKDGHEIEMHSGHTFRFRPDGSRIEIYTRGQVNPFGMTWDNHFNLYTADCHSKPITQLIPGAYYDSFGKPHDGLGYAPHTTKHDHGSTGLCGLAWYEADHFPKEWNGCMFLGNVVTNRINVDRIVWKGATPVAEELPDFLVSKDPWFRPTDIKLGADGALYVSDFYNKIVGHYEVDLKHPQRDKAHGRVWRIVWVGKTTNKTWDFSKFNNETLSDRLKNGSIIQKRFTELELEARGITNNNPETKFDMKLWELASPQQKKDMLLNINKELIDDDVTKLLEAVSKIPNEDTHLYHAAKIALRDVLVRKSKWPLANDHTRAELLFEIAMGSEGNQPTQRVREMLADNLIKLTSLEKAYEYLGKNYYRPYGGYVFTSKFNLTIPHEPMVNAYFRGAQTVKDKEDQRVHARATLVQYLNYHPIKQTTNPIARFQIIKTAALVVQKNEQADAIALTCIEFAKDKSHAETDRFAAFEAALAISPAFDRAEIHDFIQNNSFSIKAKEQLVLVLVQLNKIVDRPVIMQFLSQASYRTATSIAVAIAKDRPGVELLFQAIRQGKASPRLLQEKLVLDSLKTSRTPDWEDTVSYLTKGLPKTDARLAALIKTRGAYISKSPGDATKGKELFAKNCAACHRIGDDGGKVGPNLDGIGTRGLERLLEDTLDPNRNVDNAFRASKFEMKDGKQVVGLLVRTEGAVYVVADAEGKEQRLPTAQVDSHTILPMSPMPTDVAEKLKEDEFAHLMAYLLSVKAK